MFKLTLPEEDGFYAELVAHPKVLRVVALSGGYSRERGQRPPRPQPRRDRQLLPRPHRGPVGPAVATRSSTPPSTRSIKGIYEASIT